jgi:hypothetical protein
MGGLVLSALFCAAAAGLVVATMVAFLTVGQLRLAGSAGLRGDGLRPGSRPPRWSAVDHRGRRQGVPSETGRWQMLLFADHSLQAFPLLVDGVRQVRREPEGPDVIVVTPEATAQVAREAITELGLDVPVVAVPPRVYHQYNVRVMPWAFFVDPGGTVWASSLLNLQWQVQKLEAIARARAAEHAGPVSGATPALDGAS